MGSDGRAALLALSMAVASPALLSGLAGAAPGWSEASRNFFFKDSRAQLAMARAKGKQEVSLVLAARPGKTEAVAAEVERLGGRVRVREEDVGYLRATVPTGRAEELIRFPGVQTADMDIEANEMPPYFQPMMSGPSRFRGSGNAPSPTASPGAEEWPPPRPDITARRAYSPLKDLGALEWKTRNPTYDGRGVTIAVLDGFVDFLLPELQEATTLDGKPTRKVIDVLNLSDPLEDDSEYRHWVFVGDRVRARGGRLTYGGETYAPPRPGSFRIGIFDVCKFSGYVVEYFRAVLDRPGVSTSVDRPIAVLLDERTKEVWVDADQDRSFADEKPMKNYAEKFDFGVLGQDDPDTPVRETIPFVIQTDPGGRYVSLNTGLYGHGTMVAGAAVASRGRDGLFNGVAPGARLVSMFQASTTHSMVEGLIRAFRDPRIDVIVLEENVYIAMPYVIGDGRFTVTAICSRLIDKYKKPFLVPANNSPGLNTVIEHGLAANGFGVGAYESRENFLLSRAARVADEDNLHWVGSWGPSGNGTLQPDILSPSEVLTTSPGSRPGESMKAVYDAPPGYGMCGGTSCATPVAAGAVALLISAARQEGVPYDAERLYRSITSTARHLSNIGTYKQGNGLIQVAAAWEMLRKLPTGEAPLRISSRASVKTAVSGWLDPPHAGPGIYEREGWTEGETGERVIEFSRSSGGREPMEFRLAWTGNDETFSSPPTIRLPLNEPTRLPVRIAPRFPGVHSALLTLENPRFPGFAYRIMNTVVAAEPFQESAGYVIKKEMLVPRPGAMELFFDVPPGVAALRVELQAPKETVQLVLYPPDGREDTVWVPPTETTQTRSFAHPIPGVWAVVLSSRFDAFTFDESRPATLPPTKIELTASVVGAEVTPSVARLELDQPGATRDVSLVLKNRYAEFSGAAVSVPLASMSETRDGLADREQRVFPIEVPTGTSRLALQVSEVSDPEADLDLYLFDCTGKSCQPRRSRVGPGAEELLSLDSPAPGAWKLVVDAARLPKGKADFTYRDFLFHPKYGSLAVADGASKREAGASWKTKGNVWVAEQPGGGRRLCAVLPVMSDGIVAARQAGAADFSSFESWKIGGDRVPLGSAVISLETADRGAVKDPTEGQARAGATPGEKE